MNRMKFSAEVVPPSGVATPTAEFAAHLHSQSVYRPRTISAADHWDAFAAIDESFPFCQSLALDIGLGVSATLCLHLSNNRA